MTDTGDRSPAGRLSAFLATDPRDVGCAGAMEVLHVYVDYVAAGADTARFAGVVAHLRACGPCSDEFDGLLAAVSQDPWPDGPGSAP
ncbi:hypothetical protein [Streptomyces montanisoli]|uniref:Zf-HC2 domain-containing protein n=1 Tax=Streptomyces montanisoli TaxID=2798581 RepID=A0A940RVI5_9ACTN|nr:hypothetical protein [Streptomyces montanisoli]MBP0458286.1 hypothetical protein [Streptomyces montanisoli]